MRRLNSQFTTKFLSEAGFDSRNGTYYGFIELDQYYCMAVAEGYDAEGGRESAKLAVDTVIEAFVQNPGISSLRLRRCLKKAHKSLVEQSVRIRLKAGIILVVSDYTRFRYASCGNIMLYALRDIAAFHQSPTHTVHQTMIDENKMVYDHEQPAEDTKNLYHYLGGTAGVNVSDKFRLKEGDVLLAATESFWSKITRVEILDAFESIKSESEFLEDLQELYLRGSTENLPACCLAAVSAKKVYKENTGLRKKVLVWSLIIVLILAIVGTAVYFYLKNSRKKQREVQDTVSVYEDTGDRYLAELSCILAKQQYEKAIDAGKGLKDHQEKIKNEQEISGKINISTALDEAALAYDAQNYVLARQEYKKALDLTAAAYPEMSALTAIIKQKMKIAGTGIEIDNYIQNAALKEAEGDLESAAILYERAEAMLRILDSPELLKQVQLSLLRVEERVQETEKAEKAKKRDEVIADANQTAALDAVIAGDYEAAIGFFEKIRDSYIAMEENEKAKEVTATILALQKQERAAMELDKTSIEENKTAAMEAVLAGDYETAIALYEEIRDSYLEMEDTKAAAEMTDMITSLQKQTEQSAKPAETIPEEEKQPVGPGEKQIPKESEEEQALKGPGEVKRPSNQNEKGIVPVTGPGGSSNG